MSTVVHDDLLTEGSELEAAAEALLAAYAVSGVVETAAVSLETPPAALDAGLRAGRTLREIAHDLRRDPVDLQLDLARGAQSAWIDDRTAAELILGAGALLDRALVSSSR